MLLWLAFLAQDYVARYLRKTPVAAYGPFTLEREDCIASDPPVAVLHYAPCKAIARLNWSTADGRIVVKYEDNGGLLGRTFSFPIKSRMPDACSLADYTTYRARAGSDADWLKSRRAVVATLSKCSRLTPLQIAAYDREFTAAAPHYGEATTALRRLAVSMFGDLRRCTAQKLVVKNDPTFGFTCTRQEGPRR